MVGKEKAKELVNRFSKLDKGLDEKEWKGKDVSFEEFHKQCALICVDEMIGIYYNEGYDSEDYKIVYLEEVKKEISKL